MKNLLIILVALISLNLAAQDSKAYVMLSAGAVFPNGGEYIINSDQGVFMDQYTGLDLNLNLGYRITDMLGLTATWGAAANEFDQVVFNDDAPEEGAVFSVGYLGIGPMFTYPIGIADAVVEFRPQLVLSMSGLTDFEGGDNDITAKGSGYLASTSWVFGSGPGLKFSINIDYLRGKFKENELGGITTDLSSGNTYVRISMGAGLRYNF